MKITEQDYCIYHQRQFANPTNLRIHVNKYHKNTYAWWAYVQYDNVHPRCKAEYMELRCRLQQKHTDSRHRYWNHQGSVYWIDDPSTNTA